MLTLIMSILYLQVLILESRLCRNLATSLNNKAGHGPATKQVGPLFSPKECLGRILV